MLKVSKKYKLCIITTVDLSLDMLFPNFYALAQSEGYQITGICADVSNGKHVENVRNQGVKVIKVPMTREFTPWQDLKSLIRLYRIFKKYKFDIIHYSTPKASLLSALAGCLMRDSYKLYTLRGLGYTAFKGPKHIIAKTCEKIACRLADNVIAISPSLATEAIKEKLVLAKHIQVLGAGSSKGVNLETFTKTEKNEESAIQIRKSLNIAKDDVVIGYAGRLTSEKGLLELYTAFKNLSKEYENIHLLLVGAQDQRNPLSEQFVRELEMHSKIHLLGHKDNLPIIFTSMDIFVLPSYREGFGNVLIEASAMELPVVASNIPGCRDAVLDSETGFLVQVGDSDSLLAGLKHLVTIPELRKKMGLNGRKWVEENFDRRTVWSSLLNLYDECIEIANNEVYE
jgi:glycosyltransferase involved in cell wall biosynthesis